MVVSATVVDSGVDAGRWGDSGGARAADLYLEVEQHQSSICAGAILARVKVISLRRVAGASVGKEPRSE